MKKIRRKLTMVIATAMLAITMMTAMTTIKASAAEPNWITEIIESIKQDIKKKTQPAKPEKPELYKMMYIDQQRYLEKNYNMTMDQLTIVVYGINGERAMGFEDQNYIIKKIRYGMEREARFGCTPTWTEDMIRFAIDFWDQLDKWDIQVVKLYK